MLCRKLRGCLLGPRFGGYTVFVRGRLAQAFGAFASGPLVALLVCAVPPQLAGTDFAFSIRRRPYVYGSSDL